MRLFLDRDFNPTVTMARSIFGLLIGCGLSCLGLMLLTLLMRVLADLGGQIVILPCFGAGLLATLVGSFLVSVRIVTALKF